MSLNLPKNLYGVTSAMPGRVSMGSDIVLGVE